MADFKISGKNVITQAGTDEPVLASNVTLGTGIVKPSNISDAASSTLSCTTDSTITVATADTSSLSLGMAVSGTNIPANAHIVTIPNSTSFTITSAATGGATSTLTFQKGIVSAKIEDDAVATAKIADDAVTYAKMQNLGTANRVLGSSSTGVIGEVQIATDMVAAGAITAAKVAADVATQAELEALALPDADEVPHIIPNVLYPAVGNVMLDGTTSLSASTTGPNSSTVASSKYGTVQSDGRMYYYTDIAGSLPLKDPRIGGHFGNQRYLLCSAQEQVNETHIQTPESGNSKRSAVYRFDGREWVRGSGQFDRQHDENGINYQFSTAATYIEITGYFSDANIQAFQYSNLRHFTWSVDGGSTTTDTSFRTTNNIGPASGRFLNAAAWRKIGLGATLGIHTLKIRSCDSGGSTGQEFRPYAFELTAQDTTSTANKVKIQIPSQNVVSYGKKHTVAATPHFNPFAESQTGVAVAIGDTTSHGKLAGGWSGTGATYYDDTLDTATSLGLAAWVTGGNYYRPVNGGRIVRWVDSSGNIKTSVNMMPPTARGNFSGSNDYGPDASLPTSHAWTTVAKPKFSSPSTLSDVDHIQSEVVKEYHFREFGNGSSNQGTGGSGKAADFSMLSSTNDNCAYVMDDGLTGMSCKACHVTTPSDFSHSIRVQNASSGEGYIIYFIGTGWTWSGNMNGALNIRHRTTLAQNLPYGTHAVKFERLGSSAVIGIWIDGVKIKQTIHSTDDQLSGFSEMAVSQPKMPPIPKEACILSDYMLMADYVPQDAGGVQHLPKGARYVSASRDHYYNGAGMTSCTTAPDTPNYRFIHHDITSNAANETSVPGFGTRFAISGYAINNDSPQMQINDSNVTGVWGNGSVGGSSGTSPVTTLGNNKFEFTGTHSASNINYDGMFIATPTHTSSHYQEYETSFSFELIGGDRNVEQTNIKVTGDGKTWDEITRDTSHIGRISLRCNMDSSTSWSSYPVFEEWRGKSNNTEKWYFNKDFTVGPDHWICVRPGWYMLCTAGLFDDHQEWERNGINITLSQSGTFSGYAVPTWCKRGDRVRLRGDFANQNDQRYNELHIIRMDN